MSKPDRRVQRTVQLLRDSLLALILEKGYDAVTVQNITDRANLGRATFYLHFRDKEELLMGSLEETFDSLVRRIQPIENPQFLDEGSPASLIAFQHAAEHRDLYRVILSGQGAAPVAARIHDYLTRQIQEHLERFASADRGKIPPEIVANYIAGALLSLVKWWLDSDMPHPPEYMAQVFRRLTAPGVVAALRIESTSGG